VIHATVLSSMILSHNTASYLLSSSCCSSSRRFCSNSVSLISLSEDSTLTCQQNY